MDELFTEQGIDPHFSREVALKQLQQIVTELDEETRNSADPKIKFKKKPFSA